MSGITLQKVAHSLTRSVLLNTGKKIHSSDDDLTEKETIEQNDDISSASTSQHGSFMSDIVSKLGMISDDGTSNLVKTASSPRMKTQSITTLEMPRAITLAKFSDHLDEVQPDTPGFRTTDPFSGDTYDGVSFSVPTMEHGTSLFK